MSKYYKYGMRLRAFSAGSQPKEGLKSVNQDLSGMYYNILYYHRKLSDKELREYELDYLGEIEDEKS